MIPPHRPQDVYADLVSGTDIVRTASCVLRELIDEDRSRYHPEALQNMRSLGRALIEAGDGVITACALALNPYQGVLFDPDDIKSLNESDPVSTVSKGTHIYDIKPGDEVAA